jgi:hypothetical protein
MFAIGILLTATGCASTSVTPLTNNKFLLQTSAAPACGASGAQEVATQMAAVETLRRGYDRFIITGTDSQSNVSVIQTNPTAAYTTGTFNSYGNTTYGNMQTSYYGGGPMVVGTHDASLLVLMLRKGDPEYGSGVDARTVLGSDWQELVSKGINTCS